MGDFKRLVTVATRIPRSQVRVGGRVDWLAVSLAPTCAVILVLEGNVPCSKCLMLRPKETEGTSVAVGERLTFDLLGTVCGGGEPG